MAEQLPDEKQRRLWEFTLHEDLLYSERQNLFLVAESMLVVGYVEASDSDIALAISLTGLLLSLAWLYVSGRHSAIVELVQEEARSALSDYEALYARRKTLRVWRIPSRFIVAFLVPGLVLSLWIALVALVR